VSPPPGRSVIDHGMDTLGPLAGVVIGGVIAARLARDAFIRDQSMMEQRHRRETFAAYQKTLWAYAGRVKVARDLVAAAPAGAPPPDQILATLHDIALTKQRQDACRDAVADLRMFADHETQLAACAAYEAVSESFNALGSPHRDKAMSDRVFRGLRGALHSVRHRPQHGARGHQLHALRLPNAVVARRPPVGRAEARSVCSRPPR
jgi:hypothetical protein